MKKYNFILFILAFLAIQSCDNTDAYFGGNGGGIENPEIFSRLSDIVKFENVPTDSLYFNPMEDDSVTGSFGLKIFLPAGSCTGGGGNPMPDSLIVVMREYPTLQKMAMSNVQTVSDEELLVTGGNFWWKIIDANGTEYQLTQPSQVRAEQPVVLNMGSYRDMAAYYKGNIMNSGGQEVLNWTLANNSEAGWGQGEGQNIFTYYGLDLHWANCDALYDYPGERTQFTAAFNTAATLQDGEQMMLLIVNDFPSVVNITTREGANFVTYPNSIPVGITGTLIGIALDSEENLHIGSTEITVAGDDSFTVDLSEGTVAQLQGLINQAAN